MVGRGIITWIKTEKKVKENTLNTKPDILPWKYLETTEVLTLIISKAKATYSGQFIQENHDIKMA